MNVQAVGREVTEDIPTIILQNEDGPGILAIMVDEEAHAIAMAMKKIEHPRPLTHDLMLAILNALDIQVIKIIIAKSYENELYVHIKLRDNDKSIHIDAHQSDAIVLALLTDSAIYLTEEVAKHMQLSEEDVL